MLPLGNRAIPNRTRALANYDPGESKEGEIKMEVMLYVNRFAHTEIDAFQRVTTEKAESSDMIYGNI